MAVSVCEESEPTLQPRPSDSAIIDSNIRRNKAKHAPTAPAAPPPSSTNADADDEDDADTEEGSHALTLYSAPYQDEGSTEDEENLPTTTNHWSGYGPLPIPRRSSLTTETPPVMKSHPSLATSPSTPWMATLFIPMLALLAHALFYYGQVAPMWRLRLSKHVDIWANATSIKSKWAFDTTGLDHEVHFYVNDEQDVQTFTYFYAIHELWKAKNMPGKVMPRFAAILLTFFSGIWPHLKLLLLNLTWLRSSTNIARRSTTLKYLSRLGKWSLADVLTVCVMVGVLHLDWDIDPDAIQVGVLRELPNLVGIMKELYSDRQQVCTTLLKFSCNSSQKNLLKKGKCTACRSFLGQMYNHPNWAQTTGRHILSGVRTSGGGTTTLRVVGMKGIYAFCGAVILSVLLSVVVDVYDRRARPQQQAAAAAAPPTTTLGGTRSDTPDNDGATDDLWLWTNDHDRRNDDDSSTDNHDASEPLLARTHMEIEETVPTYYKWWLADEAPLPLFLACIRRKQPISAMVLLQTLLVLVTGVVVAVATMQPTMERKVDGAIPILLHDVLGVDWERNYSLGTLMQTTGAAGGWDLLLMGTFALFCVHGPLLRYVLCATGLTVPLSKPTLHTLVTCIDFIGSFCAWEVFAVAIVMVDMLMPSITSTIIRKPECAQVDGSEGHCLSVEFNMRNDFLLIDAGGAMLVAVSAFLGNIDRTPSRTMTNTNTTHHQESALLRSNNTEVGFQDPHGDIHDEHYVPLSNKEDNDLADII